MFPNTILLPNQGCIIGYRARPNGKDPDSCLFEMFSLEQIPVADYDKKITDFVPEYFDDYRDADLGEVLTQDLDNSENVTIGMHSPSFDGHRLSTEAGDDDLQPPPRRRPLPLDRLTCNAGVRHLALQVDTADATVACADPRDRLQLGGEGGADGAEAGDGGFVGAAAFDGDERAERSGQDHLAGLQRRAALGDRVGQPDDGVDR